MYSFVITAILASSAFAMPQAKSVAEVTKKETLVARAPPMSFDCADIPEVCNSMCWGAYCTQPSFGVSLFYDANKDAKDGRRTTAGCSPRPNRCSVNHDPPYQAGYQCDEYPFASTSDADKGGQVNRCVPSSENSSQGGIINAYLKSNCNCQACAFTVGFGNPFAPNVKYCSNMPADCVPDGNIFKGQNEDVAPPVKRSRSKRPGGLYLTERGMEVSFGEDMPLGTVIRHAQLLKRGMIEREMANAAMALEGREDGDDCDTGDGSDPDSDPARKMLRKRMSLPEDVPAVEFISDVIVKKLY